MKQTVSKERKQWKQRNQRHTEKVIINKKKKKPTKKVIHKQTKGETQTRGILEGETQKEEIHGRLLLCCFFNKLRFP